MHIFVNGRLRDDLHKTVMLVPALVKPCDILHNSFCGFTKVAELLVGQITPQ